MSSGMNDQDQGNKNGFMFIYLIMRKNERFPYAQ